MQNNVQCFIAMEVHCSGRPRNKLCSVEVMRKQCPGKVAQMRLLPYSTIEVAIYQ